MDDTDVEISLAERMEICDQVGDEGDADGNIQVESPEAGKFIVPKLIRSTLIWQKLRLEIIYL